MISIFRKIRQSMVKEKKVRNYILYALGEIILVMVGILLALQVNNFNEDRKLKTSINSTLRSISYDLEADTTSASSVIKFYENNQKNSLRIIKKEITKENYAECYECLSLVTIYQPLNIQDKGFNQLRNLTDNQTSEKDSLITDIVKFYSFYKPILEKSNDRMEGVVMSNFNDFEETAWFMDLAQANFSDELVSYFTESEDYRKRVTSHLMLAATNHLGMIKKYNAEAEDILSRINNRLKNEN